MMNFPITRMRRLRRSPELRALVRETTLSVNDLIAPLFVVPGNGVKKPIKSLSGQFHMSADVIVEEVDTLRRLGINGVLLFGLPETKDEHGTVSYSEQGVIQEATRMIKRDIQNVLVFADLCFCEYTSHGHCGIIVNNEVDNDKTLQATKKQAISLAQSGVDIIAPSGMIDGAVGVIRTALDKAEFKDVSIMSYAAKFASAYYGPFRDAVDSTPAFGDRRSYQLDPANSDEALREVELDIEEGADIVMVKPALCYLDVIARVKASYPVPLAAYNVSGEYAMINAAADKGLVDRNSIILETLLSIKRAGADIIITYFAKDAATKIL
jgi:porphobilinogen synthase